MAVADLYRTLRQEAINVLIEEKKRRREALKIRLEIQKKIFDKRRRLN